jgi:hypothetical protein
MIILYEGINDIFFDIKYNITRAPTKILVENEEIAINIIPKAETVVVTDFNQLLKRYPHPLDYQRLKTVMKQIYMLSNEPVLYDLSMYHNVLKNHTFDDLSSYNEGVADVTRLENDYANDVSLFITDKCNGCNDILIIGDDFVVPSQRKSIPLLEEATMPTRVHNQLIRTDTIYQQRSEKPFSELDDLFKDDLFEFRGDYRDKEVVFIYPTSVSPEFEERIIQLNSSLQKYRPNVKYLPSEAVTCNDFGYYTQFDGATLIIIGTEVNNEAFMCFPFHSGGITDTAFIEVSPWDSDEFALIINTNHSFVIESLAVEISSGAYKYKKSKNWWYLEIILDSAVYLSIMADWTLAPKVPLDFIGDGIDSFNDCIVKEDSLYCKISTLAVGLHFIPSKGIKAIVKGYQSSIGEPFERFIVRHGEKAIGTIIDLTKKFDDDIAEKAARILSEFSQKHKNILLTKKLSEGVGNIIKHGDEDIARAAVESFDKETAEKILEGAGKHMKKNAKKALSSGNDFKIKTAFRIQKTDELADGQEIFIASGEFMEDLRNDIFVNRRVSKAQARIIEGKLGLDPGLISKDSKFYLFQFENADEILQTLPDITDGVNEFFMKKPGNVFGEGVTLGGCSERIILTDSITDFSVIEVVIA